MRNSDTSSLIAAIDVPAALGLLTRLPVRVDFDAAKTRGASGAWAYPVVGAVVGLIAATLGWMALSLGLSAPIAAVFVVATQTIITGAMHEDGLADCADGFWGGWDPAHRLEIMRDSHVGAYGVVALVLGILLRWLAVSAVLTLDNYGPILIVAAMASRATMVGVMTVMKNARDNGLSQSVGRPNRNTALVAVGLTGIACLGLVGLLTVAVLGVAAIAATACGALAWSKVRGQTGDVLGGTQQVTEVAVLLCVISLAG